MPFLEEVSCPPEGVLFLASVGFVLWLFLHKSGKLCMEYMWSLNALAGCMEVDTINTSVRK